MPKIFVDTWAWYALTDRNDNDHSVAEAANNRLLQEEYTFVTTNFVLSEAVTLIRYKIYHDVAVEFWNTAHQLRDSGLVEIIRVNEAHEEHAWTIELLRNKTCCRKQADETPCSANTRIHPGGTPQLSPLSRCPAAKGGTAGEGNTEASCCHHTEVWCWLNMTNGLLSNNSNI